jgi:hypothetical protein
MTNKVMIAQGQRLCAFEVLVLNRKEQAECGRHGQRRWDLLHEGQ